MAVRYIYITSDGRVSLSLRDREKAAAPFCDLHDESEVSLRLRTLCIHKIENLVNDSPINKLREERFFFLLSTDAIRKKFKWSLRNFVLILSNKLCSSQSGTAPPPPFVSRGCPTLSLCSALSSLRCPVHLSRFKRRLKSW